MYYSHPHQSRSCLFFTISLLILLTPVPARTQTDAGGSTFPLIGFTFGLSRMGADIGGQCLFPAPSRYSPIIEIIGSFKSTRSSLSGYQSGMPDDRYLKYRSVGLAAGLLRSIAGNGQSVGGFNVGLLFWLLNNQERGACEGSRLTVYLYEDHRLFSHGDLRSLGEVRMCGWSWLILQRVMGTVEVGYLWEVGRWDFDDEESHFNPTGAHIQFTFFLPTGVKPPGGTLRNRD